MQLVAVKAESRIENNYTSRALVKTNRNKANAPTATDSQLVDMGNGRADVIQASTIQNGLRLGESAESVGNTHRDRKNHHDS